MCQVLPTVTLFVAREVSFVTLTKIFIVEIIISTDQLIRYRLGCLWIIFLNVQSGK